MTAHRLGKKETSARNPSDLVEVHNKIAINNLTDWDNYIKFDGCGMICKCFNWSVTQNRSYRDWQICVWLITSRSGQFRLSSDGHQNFTLIRTDSLQVFHAYLGKKGISFGNWSTYLMLGIWLDILHADQDLICLFLHDVLSNWIFVCRHLWGSTMWWQSPMSHAEWVPPVRLCSWLFQPWRPAAGSSVRLGWPHVQESLLPPQI